MAAPNGIVTLMSDFGTVDGYVAAMKGSVLRFNRDANLVDVTHHIPPRDITEAAFQIATVWSAFPEGTIHLIVVDPGVGSDRRAIGVEAGGHYFIAPDNGLLTLIASNVVPDRVFALDRPEFFLADVSSTFHGRDIFAPVAGHLSTGAYTLDELGHEVALESMLQLPWAPTHMSPLRVHAPVVSIDRFGNCRTLITRQDLPGARDAVYVRCGDVTVRGIHETYSDLPRGRSMALFGSHGGLEVAVSGGSAATSWEISRGDDVEVYVDDGHAD